MQALQRSVGVLLAGMLGTTLVVPAAGAGETDPAPSLQARAVADGMRIGFGMPKFLIVEQFMDGGGPVAQAVTDELSNSGFASLPYPGDNGIGGPGTVAGLSGAPSPPAYPFYVASNYPSQQEASWGQEGWQLHARSNDSSSQASARGGGSHEQAAVLASSATAATSRDAASGAVVAEAGSDVEGFRIGNVLSIGRVVSTARSSRLAGGETTRASSFSVQAMSIGGQAVDFGPTGLALAGQKTPLPDSSPLRKALADQGITFTYVAPVDAPDGITSAGLSIVQTFKLPSGHVMRTTYTMGRAHAQTVSISADEQPTNA